MDIQIFPKKLRGPVAAVPSKSLLHRYLICAAFSRQSVFLVCRDAGKDVRATIACLQALGASIRQEGGGWMVTPIAKIPPRATLPCGESGTTLRLLLPMVGALGIDATFLLEGRLPQRPLSPLWEEMERMGCSFSRPTENTLCCSGKLQPGEYHIPGNVSSQFISGLMLALPLIPGQCRLQIHGNMESAAYVQMTEAVIAQFRDAPPQQIQPEGDWSNAAFWLAANALGSNIAVTGLQDPSLQGDHAILQLLPRLEQFCSISAAQIPDLIPVLSVVAAAKNGAIFTDIQRLRLKESDRVASIASMIRNLGGEAQVTETTLAVTGTGLVGGRIDACADHRIAMSAAIAATVCTQPVTISGCECVAKSDPHFWEDYVLLGGQYV